MATKKPRIVIIGAGMAGLTAAHKLHTSPAAAFDVHVVEGGDRIGGRIHTSVFCDDRIEMGATWIHGINDSPIYEIAQKLNSLESAQPWERMDGFHGNPITVLENGYKLDSPIGESVSKYFDLLMDFSQGKEIEENNLLAKCVYELCVKNGGFGNLSIGMFLRKGFEVFTGFENEVKGFDNWDKKSILEAVFEMKENTRRTYTSADDLATLDFKAESEYKMFPGEEITIAKGYMSIIEYLASVLPEGCVQLGKKVTKIEWRSEGLERESGDEIRAVKVNFSDGSCVFADHVILTVSLGVLKAHVCENSDMFDPPLPRFKVDAISKLGYGVVNKLFLELNPSEKKFPFLQMAYHKPGSRFWDPKIPSWMRRTNSICPIYENSSVVLSWFAGKEALELESLDDEEIVKGVSNTLSCFSIKSKLDTMSYKFGKVLKTQWGNDPLFLGSYSYVAVGSSGDDLDTMAMPLPENVKNGSKSCFPLQIMFAGEATHRTHYSTTHGAYFSGIREANRLLQYYGL